MSFITNALGITGSGPTNNFNATAPVNTFQTTPLTQSDYANAIAAAVKAAAGGTNVNAGVQGQEANLASALGATAAGQGPNPALDQLHQTTDQNIKQAAGLIASQKGLNPALAARIAANGAASTNQAAAGQAATLGAQQQIAAQQELAGVLSNQANQNLAQEGANTQLLGTAAGAQSSQNANDLGLQQLQQATQAQNANLKLGAEQINAGVAGQNAQTNAGIVGGLLSGAGAAATLLNKGGEVQDKGGQVYDSDALARFAGALVQHLASGGGVSDISIPQVSIPTYGSGSQPMQQGISDGTSAIAKALSKPSAPLVPNSPLASNVVTPEQMAAPLTGATPIFGPLAGQALAPIPLAMAQGGLAHGGPPMPPFLAALSNGGAIDYRGGGTVPGKAKVKGDSPKNDTVPAMLSPGEEVLPRSVTQAPDAPDKAKAFVEAIQRKNEEGQGPKSYGEVIAAQRHLHSRLAALEKHYASGGTVGAVQAMIAPPMPPPLPPTSNPGLDPRLLRAWSDARFAASRAE